MLRPIFKQRGISLVELMIAMVLGLLLMLAIFSGYAPIKRTVAQSKALEQASEVLRFAALTFTNSIKQADRLIAVAPDRLTLEFRVAGGSEVRSCLGNRKVADFTEQYRFTPPVLSCDDGGGARLLVTGLKELEFGEQGALVTIRLLPEGLPVYLLPGVTVQVARRKAIWEAALTGKARGGAG